MEEQNTYTAFAGEKLIASGPLEAMLPEVGAWSKKNGEVMILIFHDQTGRPVDFDLESTPRPPRVGPGRPRLGVVSREVSLLPRHWEWLEQQSGGASAALRKLVERARKHEPDKQRARHAMESADRLMTAIAGNFPGYEEATRALYAADRARFATLIRDWPHDIREHVHRLAEDAFR